VASRRSDGEQDQDHQAARKSIDVNGSVIEYLGAEATTAEIDSPQG